MSNILPTVENPITFVDIYNALNDNNASHGTTHNGSDPISLGSFLSQAVTEDADFGPLNSNEDRKFNKTSAIPTVDDETGATLVLLSSSGTTKNLEINSYNFVDDGGLNSNYSTNHSRYITFDAGAGNVVWIKIKSFEFEHSSSSMYDRLGITCSNTESELSLSSGNLSSADSTLSQYLYQSSISSPSWGTSWVSGNGGYGTGGGWIFPNTDGVDVKANNNSGWINTWYKIDARYVRFWFISDGSATEPGWDIYLVSKNIGVENDTGLVPKNNNIIANGSSINLNSTTKDTTFKEIESEFMFYDNGGESGMVGPNSSGDTVRPADGTIKFYAGDANKKFKVTFNKFRFPASNSIVQAGQLSIKDGNTEETLNKISVPDFINPPTGKQSPSGSNWDFNGNVVPWGGNFLQWGQEYYTNGPYIEFTYINNVEPSTNFQTNSATYTGWDISMQIVTASSSTGNDTLAPNIFYPQISIKDDFSGRSKTHDTSIQVTNIAGSTSDIITDDTSTVTVKFNLLSNNDSANISSNGSFTTSDIEAPDCTVSNLITAGGNAFLASIAPSGTLPRVLSVYIKHNRFYASGDIWNRKSSAINLNLNMPKITLTGKETVSNGEANLPNNSTTVNKDIIILLSCQHDFDGPPPGGVFPPTLAITGTASASASAGTTVQPNTLQYQLSAMQEGVVNIVVPSGAILAGGKENPNAATYTYNYVEGFKGWQAIQELGKAFQGKNVVNHSISILDEFSKSVYSDANLNVFARLGYQTKAERLVGTTNVSQLATNNGFVYNDVSSRLSTGNIIKPLNFAQRLLPTALPSELDGKPWYGIAWFAPDYKGMQISVFTGQQINNLGAVIGDAPPIPSTNLNQWEVRHLFKNQGRERYYQIYTVVFNAVGDVVDFDIGSQTGWEFSNNQGGGDKGYYSETRFSLDDGIWGFQIDEQVDGNTPGENFDDNYFRTYGLQNYNGTDSSDTTFYWDEDGNGSGPTREFLSPELAGFVFSGDAS